ncbi:MAG: hypothetical protein KDC94_08145 [Aequorivita sp.]|nr:hypothetical protein [Aequorivita sp.]MCB0454833.1 hypothetical protein [Aequorivita sp.]MCB0468760.1 hypothetical protein [Aequorivita sp.]
MKRFLSIFFLLMFSSQYYAQVKTDKIDLIELVNDLIITKKTNDNLKQVWWIPEEYWDVALNDSKYSNVEIQNEIKNILKDYIVVSVVDVDIKLYGGLKSNDIVISLSNINGEKFAPMEQDEGNEELFTLLEMIKPTMKNMLGQFGEKMNFYVFKNIDDDGNLIAGPYQKGEITININKEDFNYKLPLGSLVEKKTCPFDNELMNGNWDYCPWHGKQLIEKQTK